MMVAATAMTLDEEGEQQAAYDKLPINHSLGAIHKMAPVGVCGALLHTGQCWMYGWLREAEKNSPLHGELFYASFA